MKEFRLDNEPKISSGFKIPENYFDDLSEKINTNLPKTEPKVISIFQKQKTWFYSVAAILIFGISILMVQQLQNKPTFDSEFLESYIAQNTTISEYDLLELLEKEDLENMQIDLNIQDTVLEEIVTNNANLEQYITN
jgi:hypothetical protein